MNANRKAVTEHEIIYWGKCKWPLALLPNSIIKRDQFIDAIKKNDLWLWRKLKAEYLCLGGLIADFARKRELHFLEYGDLNHFADMGIYKAIEKYNFHMKASFKTFCRKVIKRKLKDAVKQACRKRHKALNIAISIDNPDIEQWYLIDRSKSIDNSFKNLNEKLYTEIKSYRSGSQEAQIVELVLQELTPEEIKERLGISQSQLYEAIRRIRTKVKAGHV